MPCVLCFFLFPRNFSSLRGRVLVPSVLLPVLHPPEGNDPLNQAAPPLSSHQARGVYYWPSGRFRGPQSPRFPFSSHLLSLFRLPVNLTSRCMAVFHFILSLCPLRISRLTLSSLPSFCYEDDVIRPPFFFPSDAFPPLMTPGRPAVPPPFPVSPILRPGDSRQRGFRAFVHLRRRHPLY